jgi:hypothetical protein
MSDCVMTNSVTNPSSGKQDHTVFIRWNWVHPKYSSKKQSSSLIKQHILTLNRYAPLISLQDPVINKNYAIVVKELGLLYDIQRKNCKVNLPMWGQTAVIIFLLYLMVKSVLKQLSIREWCYHK